MFRSLLNKTLALGVSTLLSSQVFLSNEFDDLFEKLDYLSSVPSTPFWESRSSLIYFHSKSEPLNQKARVKALSEKTQQFGYSIQRVYFEPGETQDLLMKKLNMTEEELKSRVEYKSNFAFVKNSKSYKAPIGISLNELDSWVSKCQVPFFNGDSVTTFYGFNRRILSSDFDFVLVYHGLDEAEEEAVLQYSRFKFTVPVFKLSQSVAEHVGVPEKGLYLAKNHSKYNGMFDKEMWNEMRFIKFKEEMNFEKIHGFVDKHSLAMIPVCDDFERLQPTFQSIFKGPKKVLFVMSSNVKSDSKKYLEFIKQLHQIYQDFKDQVSIIIVPNDKIASKFGLLRDKRKRRFQELEIKFVDYTKLVLTKEENGKFPIIDCSADLSQCKDLSDSSYTRKNYMKKRVNYENLKEFVSQSLSGDFEQYYETDTTPSIHVKKLNADNFTREVVDSEQTVLVELYGKYCPGCAHFKPFYSEIAEEMKSDTRIKFAKVCIDHNMISQIADMTPFTPAFWIYKKGMKSEPVLYEGKMSKEDLVGFINKHISQDPHQMFKVV